MTNEEIKSLIEGGLAEVKSKVDSATKTSADEVKSLSDKLGEIQDQIEEAKKSGVTLELVEKMQDHLDKLDVKLQKKSVESKAAPTLDNELKSKFEEKAIADAINELKNNRGAAVNMDVKAVTSMTLGSYTGSALTTEIDRSISAAPQKRAVHFLCSVPSTPSSSCSHSARRNSCRAASAGCSATPG